MDKIINKVANSSLEVFDLEDYYTPGIRSQIDISIWMEDGFFLKEKDFREHLKNHNWIQYQNHFVAINCSTDAIIPSWAIILVAVYVTPIAKKVVSGMIVDLEISLYETILSKIDYTKYKDKSVIIKGCSRKFVPKPVYVIALNYLLPFAKSIMYGEACAAVPLYKKRINQVEVS